MYVIELESKMVNKKIEIYYPEDTVLNVYSKPAKYLKNSYIRCFSQEVVALSTPLYSRREILVGKGFFDSNCPTYDYWTLNFLLSVTTILQRFEKKLSQLKVKVGHSLKNTHLLQQ